MAMQERVCPDCGAINQLSAESCWRCLELLANPAHEVAAVADPRPSPA